MSAGNSCTCKRIFMKFSLMKKRKNCNRSLISPLERAHAPNAMEWATYDSNGGGWQIAACSNMFSCTKLKKQAASAALVEVCGLGFFFVHFPLHCRTFCTVVLWVGCASFVTAVNDTTNLYLLSF